ncbi:MAG: rod shape-determining protein MreC [Proteobacteria bacterium]|nr:rod shape-determining protein MreC [Pseudomonadota bacterium]
MKQHRGSVLRFAAPVRNAAQRFAYLFLLIGAVAIMLLGRADPLIFERTRMAVTDVVAPVLDAVSRPLATISDVANEVRSLTHLREENAALRVDNARLIQWQIAARKLISENENLRQLLNFVPDNLAKSVTARVIGDSGGTFVRNILINAGRRVGVMKGQAALVSAGLVGRVQEVGDRSARILLITDLNSRIPVLVESTRQRAVLAGDNSDWPRLLHLPANTVFAKGERIVTSGHGGVFPPGLPVGVVIHANESAVVIQPFVQGEKVEFVRLMDFGLSGVLQESDRRRGPDRPVQRKKPVKP